MPSVDELRQLARLRAEGALSEEQFETERERALSHVPEAEEIGVSGSPAQRAAPEMGTTLVLVTLAALVAGILSMVFFNVGLVTGATVAVAALSAAAYLMHQDIEPED